MKTDTFIIDNKLSEKALDKIVESESFKKGTLRVELNKLRKKFKMTTEDLVEFIKQNEGMI